MTNPLISIVVPCYNQAQFLDECLQSVIDQTYQNWECIIVNDGSLDNTEEIAKQWIQKDARFLYLHKENGGVSSARNFGIERANGEWILPLDGDDVIGNDYLNFATKELKNNDIVFCKAQYFGEKEGEIVVSDYDSVKMLLENQIFCSAFFTKKDWKKIGGYDETFLEGYEDWDFWLCMIKEKKGNLKVKKLEYPGFFYRIKQVSRNQTAMLQNDRKLRHILFKKHIELYTKHIQDFTDIVYENRKIQLENSHLRKILSSKRYVYISKIFKFFNR